MAMIPRPTADRTFYLMSDSYLWRLEIGRVVDRKD
jgi:hypothetical protein